MLCVLKILLGFAALSTLSTSVCTLKSEKYVHINEVQRSSESTTDYKLPDDVKPSEYFIHLTPFIIPNNFTFNGVTKIIATVIKTTKQIVLHVDLIEIHSVTISSINSKKVPLIKHDIKSITKTEKYQFLKLALISPISAGTNISIEILYTGVLTTDMRGFYRSSYNLNNETRWIAGTHLQPTGARRVFPCFDEPAFKARFHISIVIPKSYSAVSNMPVKAVTKNGIVEFEATPLMSTYLVAVVVSDFKSITTNEYKIPCTVWTTAKLIHQLPYALSVMPKAVDYFENQLNVPYSLPKLEMVAMPDFSEGAMENWGLVIYREIYMLYDAAITPATGKRKIRNTISHEIAHQWFGNLVTPKWWDFIWLSESFAQFFQYHTYTDAVNLSISDALFIVDALQPAFTTNALSSAQPITRKVYNPTEIRSLFDVHVIYNKGASVVRMLYKLLGSEIFFSAMRKYLQTNQYSFGTPELLYLAIEEEINLNNYKLNTTIAELLNSWTLLPGFPVIHASFKGNTVVLSQERFFSPPLKNVTDETTWIVPINWATRSNPNFNNTRRVVWLTNKETAIPIENANKDWVILNIQQTGFYRVNYDEKMWRRIIDVLKSQNYKTIHEINRASLIDDLFNLAKISLVDYDIVMSATQYLTQETNYIPWKAALTGLNYLKQRLLGYPEIYESYRSYVLSLLEPSYRKLGFNELTRDTDFDILYRELVLKSLCDFDQKQCVNSALEIFEQWQHNDSYSIPSNQQNFIYCTAVRYGSSQHWNFLWQKHEESNSATEKLTILAALACSQNSTNLERLLFNTVTPNHGIRKQDVMYIFLYVIESSLLGLETTLNFIETNYNKILEYVGDDNVIERIFGSLSKSLSSEKLVVKFQNIIQNNKKSTSNLFESLESSLDGSIYEINLYNKNAPKIFEWLKKNHPISKVN